MFKEVACKINGSAVPNKEDSTEQLWLSKPDTQMMGLLSSSNVQLVIFSGLSEWQKIKECK